MICLMLYSRFLIFCYSCLMLKLESSDFIPEFLIDRCNDLILCFVTLLVARGLSCVLKIMLCEFGIRVTFINEILMLDVIVLGLLRVIDILLVRL